MSELLQPLTLPLQGSRLIEASAGTGKTWTIAALYLRLVLGHGTVRPLLPGEILVMTFTRAATRELSDRIRQRLTQAAACFRGEALPPADDAFLAELLAAYPAQPGDGGRAAAAWRLEMAAQAMDDAAIHTIDAWCQRMLREHAFDSGCLFDEELQADETEMRAEAAHDYWRQQVYPLQGEALTAVLALWPDAPALRQDALALHDKPLPAGAGQGTLAETLARARAERSAALAALKAGWAERAAQMRDWLDAQTAGKAGPFEKTKLKPATYGGWLNQLVQWAGDAGAELPVLTATARERLTPEGLRAVLKPGASVALPPCFDAFAQLMQDLSQLPQTGSALRAHAAAQVALRLQALKAQTGSFGFADMLERLDRALDEGRRGEKARQLRQRILQQYPAALIDEFQDTSPVQLSIFERLYRIADNGDGQLLLLIGDPKQSIYGFRGADIQSYLHARRATAGRHHVLGTNHRSTKALVAAVNGCFEAAENRPGAGAFMFRVPGPGDAEPATTAEAALAVEAGYEAKATAGALGAHATSAADAADEADARGAAEMAALPFVSVDAKGREEHFVTSAGDVPALVLSLDPVLRRMDDARARHAALCAERIAAWLNDPGAGFARPGRPLQRLRPADIAVLVRTGTEAAAMRQALRRRGVASVYLSDRDSVFASDEARDLLRLLQAAAAPREMRRARAALASGLVGLSLPDLLALADDDALFDARCELLGRLQLAWQTQGLLAMVRQAVQGLDLAARWLGGGRAAGAGAIAGERRITNLLHLAELLQAESARLDGEQALIRWFSQQIDAAASGQAGGGDERVLRLESDADLVQVVTVHKSKGLEYPLVLLPFAAHFRAEDRKRQGYLLLNDAQGLRRLLLAPTAAQLAAADQERQRQDLRLLYVALTRARHGLWLGLSALQIGNSPSCVWHRSAVGYLVSGTGEKTPEAMAADLRALATAVPGLRLEVNTSEGDPGLTLSRLTSAALPPLTAAPPYQAGFDRLWSVSSYSALAKGLPAAAAGGPSPSSDPSGGLSGGLSAGSAPPATGAGRVLRDDEPAQPEAVAGRAPARPPADTPWHRFPRGALAGNFLHDQLEWLAGEGFALASSPALQQALLRRCERQGWGHRAEDVRAWLQQVCTVPLPALGAAPGTALAELDRTLPEMEFWFPSDGLRARVVDELCRRHLLPGRARPELPDRALHGMLMGFADLVFEHQGRFGVLDYKSNALGPGDADYGPEAMAAAVLEHRYDVQAALYLLALHRLLKTRLGAAYAPARHLHGAVVLFLRGVHSASHGCFHLQAPAALVEALDALLAPAGPAGDAA